MNAEKVPTKTGQRMMQDLEDTARAAGDFDGGDYVARCWHNFAEWRVKGGRPEKPDTEESLRDWDAKENGNFLELYTESTYRTWKGAIDGQYPKPRKPE